MTEQPTTPPIPRLSVCIADGKVIMLDVARDRYSGLQTNMPIEKIEQAMQGGRSNDALALRALLPSPLDDIEASICAPITPIVLDIDQSAADWKSIFRAVDIHSKLVSYRNLLRRQGLHPALVALQALAARCHNAPERSDAVSNEVAAAVRMLRVFRSLQDQCLPTALGVADYMYRRGQRPLLVIGVTGRPFRAHGWVQIGHMLVSDRKEAIRDYTPILTL